MLRDQWSENNPNWHGDTVGYSGLHKWVQRHLLKPDKCEFCGEVRPLDLANKSHEYKRDLTDWLWLCKPCHASYDLTPEKSRKWSERLRNFNLTKRKYPIRGVCKLEGCNQPYHGIGYCASHYRKYGKLKSNVHLSYVRFRYKHGKSNQIRCGCSIVAGDFVSKCRKGEKSGF